MVGFVFLPYAACKIMPECGNFYISGIAAIGAIFVSVIAGLKTRRRLGFV